ncbi:MAG: LemA family protein [Acidimicrobiia bacterium]
MTGRRRGWMLRAAVLVVSGLVTGGVVLGLGSRGDLEQAGQRVDTAWAQLRPGLDERYLALGRAADAARERLGEDPALLSDLDTGLQSWPGAKAQAVEVQATLANRLEGLGARLLTLVQATPRLRSSEVVNGALGDMDRADPGPARSAYNQAVTGYENVRGGFPRRLVAGALGFDARRTLETPA